MRYGTTPLVFLAIGAALLVGCTSATGRDDAFARRTRERERALQVLASSPAVDRPLMALQGDGRADWIAEVWVQAGRHEATREVPLQYVPEATLNEPWPEGLPRWFGGSRSMGSIADGVIRSTGEGFSQTFDVSVNAAGVSGAVFGVSYEFAGPTSASLSGTFPVLWGVPVQTFYWPEGMVRVTLRQADAAAPGDKD